MLKIKFLITILSSVWAGMLIMLAFFHLSAIYIYFPLVFVLFAIMFLMVREKIRKDNIAYKKIKKKKILVLSHK